MSADGIVIVGGGVMGAATAFFLARDQGLRATVIERDPGYRRASSALSASSIRQQFSTTVNIRASMASLAFYRRIGAELAVDGEQPDIGLTEPGYLFLAGECGAAVLRDNVALQRAEGVSVDLLDPGALARRFAWLSTDGLTLGAHGRSTASSGEGWFDGYSVLQAFCRAARAVGVRYVTGTVRSIVMQGGRAVAVETAEGERAQADTVVIAAGAWSAGLAEQAGFSLPVRPRKRDVFVFQAPVRLPSCPLVIDPSGFWFRPEGAGYLCGAPPRHGDPDEAPLEAIDHGLFEDWIWPRLAARVPAFESLRLTGAWAGYYEMNTVDANGLVGLLPGTGNVYTACGFSGHGIQQAPAVGRGLAELIATGRYGSLDLSPLAPGRLVDGRLLIERNVI